MKLSGTVAELRKRLGETVFKDEVLAILESREVADAKSEYLAARLTNELLQDLADRDKVFGEKLRARTAILEVAQHCGAGGHEAEHRAPEVVCPRA